MSTTYQVCDTLRDLSGDVSQLGLGLGGRPVEVVHHHLKKLAVLNCHVVASLVSTF